MTTMIDLIVTPRLRNLDMNKLPKILRTHITSRLHVSLYVENAEKKIIDKLFSYQICATLFEFLKLICILEIHRSEISQPTLAWLRCGLQEMWGD